MDICLTPIERVFCLLNTYNFTTMTRIIKFEKNDCAPCDQVSNFLDSKGISYEKVNPFDKPELAIQFKVRTVPTVIVLDDNQEQKRIIGFKPEELSTLAAQ